MSSHLKLWGKGVLCKGRSKDRGPEVGAGLGSKRTPSCSVMNEGGAKALD